MPEHLTNRPLLGHQLFAAGRSHTGSVTLAAQDRRDLADGRLMIRIYLERGKDAAARVICRCASVGE